MSTTYNIEIREFNGIDYDILYPITTIENVNGLTTSLDELSTNINDLDTRKANVSDLGTLAEKNSISLTSDVSGVLPVSNGGTGSATVGAHQVFAGTSGTGTSSPSFRGLESSDIPSLNASKITSGTLEVSRGGTGVTSNPSMLINLASTTAANVFATSPRPGITGMLPVANGGTGANTKSGALSNLGITISTVSKNEGDALTSGTIYIYYN